MGVEVRGAAVGERRLRLRDELQDARDGDVDVLEGQLARGDGVEHALRAEPARRRHLEVEARVHGLLAVEDGTPVGHDDALEAPLVAQDVGEEPAVLRREDAVDAVVRAHDGPRLRLGDDTLERRQVDLAEGALVDVGGHAHPVRLLVVRGEVLERRADPLALDALHEGRPDRAREPGVLGEVLEVAPAERRALHVDARAEDDGHALGACLLADRGAHAGEEVDVPGRGEGGGGRERDGRVGGEETEVVAVLGLGAQAVRAVGQPDLADAEALDGRGAPHVGAAEEGGLLFERELLDELGDVGHVGGGRVGGRGHGVTPLCERVEGARLSARRG